MIIVIIKDEFCDDCEITRCEFASKEEADEKMPKIMEDLSSIYGSGSCGFYGVIEELE